MYQDLSDHILIVDGDDYFRELLVDVLGEHGVRAQGVGSGLDALGLLTRAPYPRLILLDLLTPRLDGWAVLGALRGSGLLGQVEVVGMTALEVATPPGMRRVLRKPFELYELLSAVGANARRKGGLRSPLATDAAPLVPQLLS